MTFKDQLERAAKEHLHITWDILSSPDVFVAGARWALNAEVVKDMREALAEIIRNSHDIVAKKRASNAMTAFDKALAEVGE